MQDIDPRVKLLSVMLLTIVIFFVDKLSICVSMVLSIIFFRILMRIPFPNIKVIKNLIMLASFIILVQTIFGPGDNYIFAIWRSAAPLFGLKWEGLFLGLLITCRLFSIMMIFPVLTETTTGGSLAAGIAALGVPYRIAFIISAAFNQVPRFSEEARLIMDVQKLRGSAVFEKTTWKPSRIISKIKGFAGICLPLVLNAMRKAQVSSIAMDSRAFGIYKTRSWLEKPKMKVKDFLFILGCIIFSGLLIFLNNADYPF